MKNILLTLILLLSVLFVSGCKRTQDKTFSDPNFAYNLSSPDKEYLLPETLREISGQSYLSSGKLACVQDEKGIVFIFDTGQSKVIKEIKFGKKGDYEGIEVIKDQVYVIESNGEISSFSIKNPGELHRIETPLRERNDVEGLGYYPASNSLLIACKANPDVNGNGAEGKAIYRFDPENSKMEEEPFITIKSQDLPEGKITKIKPSGIAVNPKTSEIFVLASSHQLFIFKEKKLIQTIPLDPSIFEQPEGICFSDSGTLFISSEGDFRSGRILRFEPRF